MTSASAAPAELVKELRRALPQMAEAAGERSNWSQGRVMQDFASSIGIELDGAGSMEEVQARLDQVTAAWNALPTEERKRLMPDPSPKSAMGATATARFNATGFSELDDDPASDSPHYRRGIRAVAAREARASGFARRVRALVDWVGDGKQVTKLGVLRPALAREAYLALDLGTWERRYLRAIGLPSAQRSMSPEEKDAYAVGLAASITRAGDCLPLDRLWWSACEAGLITVTSTTARRATDLGDLEDDGGLLLGSMLLVALLERFDQVDVEPLAMILVRAMVSPDGEIDLAEVREDWWKTEGFAENVREDSDLDSERIWRKVSDDDINRCVRRFDDTGVWVRRGDDLTITDFGREFAVVVTSLAEDPEA